MAKRQHIEIVRDDTLKLIDDDLDVAMERLDGTNGRVDEILAGIEDGPTDIGESSAEPVDEVEVAESAAEPVVDPAPVSSETN